MTIKLKKSENNALILRTHSSNLHSISQHALSRLVADQYDTTILIGYTPISRPIGGAFTETSEKSEHILTILKVHSTSK